MFMNSIRRLLHGEYNVQPNLPGIMHRVKGLRRIKSMKDTSWMGEDSNNILAYPTLLFLVERTVVRKRAVLVHSAKRITPLEFGGHSGFTIKLFGDRVEEEDT